MNKKTIKLEITIESDDLNNTEELCSNFISTEINKIIERADKKYNTGLFKVRRAIIKSKLTNNISI
jgi:hypothetical protein